ncbi:MAG: hypothetical protein MJ229_00185 [bacterium]|nr:hypothetical protein [bacterium]
MQFETGIQYLDSGLKSALRGMRIESTYVGLTSENVMGFDKVGYQRKEIVNSSFAQFMGADALSTVVDDKVGRLVATSHPLDFALAQKGYFQIKGSEGIKMTRDGRFKLDKEGNLLSLDGEKVLSNVGTPIKLSIIPENIKDIKVNADGVITVLDSANNKMVKVATLGVVNADGLLVMHPEVKQGYNEHSNVSLQDEFMGMMGPLRNYDANRQMFMIENSVLSKTISQLGATS